MGIFTYSCRISEVLSTHNEYSDSGDPLVQLRSIPGMNNCLNRMDTEESKLVSKLRNKHSQRYYKSGYKLKVAEVGVGG